MRFIAFLRIIALSVVGATGPGHPELKQLRTSCHNQPSTRVSVRLEKLFAAAVTEMNTLLGELGEEVEETRGVHVCGLLATIY